MLYQSTNDYLFSDEKFAPASPAASSSPSPTCSPAPSSTSLTSTHSGTRRDCQARKHPALDDAGYGQSHGERWTP
jgi:hypothetical protein